MAQRRTLFIVVGLLVVVALLGGSLLTTFATPIFDSGPPGTSGPSGSDWNGEALLLNRFYTRTWIPIDPTVEADIKTIKVYGSTNSVGDERLSIQVHGNGFPSTVQKSFPLASMPQSPDRGEITFDVSDMNWKRSASPDASEFSLWISSPTGSFTWYKTAGNEFTLRIYAALTPPSQSFAIDFTTSVNRRAVSFTSNVVGGEAPYLYAWNFGDGPLSGSTEANPTHTYAADGTYQVRLQVNDVTNQELVLTKPVTVSGAAPTQLSVDFTHTVNVDGVTANFFSSVSGGAPPYSYNWNFGDGSVRATTKDATHTYASPGTMSVTLTVRDSASPAQEGIKTKPVTLVGQQLAPSPAFDYTVTSLNVSFTGSATGGSAPYAWLWVFGDSTASSTSQNPVHAYASARSWRVELTVTGSDGRSASVARDVSTTGVPPAGTPLTGEVAVETNKLSAEFTLTVSGGTGTKSYSWTFGDGKTSTSQSPTHAYDAPGTYTAKVTVRDSSGTINLEKTVTVTAVGGFVFTFDPMTVILLLAGLGGIVVGIVRKRLRRISVPIGVVLVVIALLMLFDVIPGL